jgi:GntR family transcriptional repressor for pyruvate dehydrogenase complex
LSAPLEAIGRPRLPDLIADQLVDAIRNGSFQPGDRLPTEQQLARELGVGRTSVREALQKLRAMRMIEVVKGRGAWVTQPLVEDDAEVAFAKWSADERVAIEDHVETRIALEAAAAGLAAIRASPDMIDELESHHVAHSLACGKGDLADVIATDGNFHNTLVGAAGNVVLSKLYRILIPEMHEFRRKTHALAGASERSVMGHARILEAVRIRDPVSARTAMVEHIWWLYESVHLAGRSKHSDISSRRSASQVAFLP